MSKPNPNTYAYGLVQQPLLQIFTPPTVSILAPGNSNKGQIGSMWINKATNTVYVLTSYLNGLPVWTAQGGVVAGGLNWHTDPAAAVALAVNSGYYLTNVGAITLTLPVASAVGDQIWIITEDSSAAAAGIQITQGDLQRITYADNITTAGAATNYQALNLFQTQLVTQLICTIANTNWAVVNSNYVPNII